MAVGECRFKHVELITFSLSPREFDFLSPGLNTSLAQRDKELSGETEIFELGPVLNCLQQYLDTVQKSKLHISFKHLKNEIKNVSHYNIYITSSKKAYHLSSTKAPDSLLSRWASDLLPRNITYLQWESNRLATAP